jgi:hypothetical protein
VAVREDGEEEERPVQRACDECDDEMSVQRICDECDDEMVHRAEGEEDEDAIQRDRATGAQGQIQN